MKKVIEYFQNNMIDFTWKIGGEAGFGVMTTGVVFSKIATRSGYNIFDYVEYPSLIRGGHNAYEVRVSDQDAVCLDNKIDILVCLNKETFEKHNHRLLKESLIIYDKNEFELDCEYKKIHVPFDQIISNLKGSSVMKNTIALGASIAVIGGDINILLNIIEEQFKKKGEEVISFNKKFAELGYEAVTKNFSNLTKKWLSKKTEILPKLVITGNDAFSLGAVIADSRFYCAYPMTPSSSVLATLASWQQKNKMVVRHAEDEISVINTALGASFAGVRSSVGTSGGGFALMVETVSLSGVTEIPIVIFLSQRPGPATGMPTWTEQGDLLFTVHAGHGEFPKIILAPGDQQEMIELTTKSFNLADIYQLPVIVMSDMYLSEGHKSIEKKVVDKIFKDYKVDKGKIVNTKKKNYLRYQITEDGISERLIPGTPGSFYQANSYEHLEDSHTTEESKYRLEQVNKRGQKWTTYLKQDFCLPKIYGDINKATYVFVSWGSTKGIILEAQKNLDKKGLKTAFIHFNHIYPLDKNKVKDLFKNNKKYILVENNSWGQFGKLLLQETGVEIKERILRYDGRPITVEEIVSQVIKL